MYTLFLIFALKPRIWELVRTAVLKCTHNLCFEQNKRKENIHKIQLKIVNFNSCKIAVYCLRGATEDDYSGQFFRIFEIIIFCFVIAICDLLHAVEATYGLP